LGNKKWRLLNAFKAFSSRRIKGDDRVVIASGLPKADEFGWFFRGLSFSSYFPARAFS